MKTMLHRLPWLFFLSFTLGMLLNALVFHWAMIHGFPQVFVYSCLLIVDCMTIALFYHLLNSSLLQPFQKLSKELSKRASSEHKNIPIEDYPQAFKAMLTELNDLFARVHADNDRNKRFSADAAHELRTPMTALKTQAQLALQMTEPQEQKKAIENVIISINRSIHVIQQLLTLSRLDHEKKLNDVAEVNLESVAAELIAFMYPQALEKGIDIELCNECHHPFILGNEAAIGILLRNLIDNAIRYSPQKARIEVKIKESNHFIQLQIIDNGLGIPEEYRDKVFDRFFRVLGTKQTGSGLGLAIVKQIIDLHKGKIILQTSGGGQGLTVTVFFRKPK